MLTSFGRECAPHPSRVTLARRLLLHKVVEMSVMFIDEPLLFIRVVTIFVEIICNATTGGFVGARYMRIRHEEIAIKLLHPQMKKCISTEEILLQMPKVENKVLRFSIFREMIIGALVGVLNVPDEHRGEEYDWPCGSHRMVTEQTAKTGA